MLTTWGAIKATMEMATATSANRTKNIVRRSDRSIVTFDIFNQSPCRQNEQRRRAATSGLALRFQKLADDLAGLIATRPPC